jgi:hypothetical protein
LGIVDRSLQDGDVPFNQVVGFFGSLAVLLFVKKI